MVVYAHPGRGKEANARNEHILHAVVGLAACLGETPLMICGDLQHTSTSRSAKAGSRTWDRRTNLLEQLKPCTPMSKVVQNARGLCTGQRGLPRGSGRLRGGAAESRIQTQRDQDHSDLGHLRADGVDDETTHDSSNSWNSPFGENGNR